MAEDKQIVVVLSIGEKDNYGSLPFKGKDGQDYKVGSKRENLFSQIIEGRAVELIWSEYKGKRYISDAHLVEAGVPLPVPQDNVPPEHRVTGVKPAAETKPAIPIIRYDEELPPKKARSMAISYAKDWAIAVIQSPHYPKDLFTIERIIEGAKKFSEFIETGQVPESKLEKEATRLGTEK